MLRFIRIVLLFIGTIVPVCAQEPCGFGSENAFDNLAKALSEAKSCQAAVARIHECAWGSSADTQLAPIVITKCERTFFDKLSAAAKKSYADEMQLCAYEYAGQEGTMYMSAAALCQVDVAAHYAADPVAASKLGARASFDCAGARTPLEKAICSDIKLGHADIVLSRVYSGLLKNANEKDKAVLVQSERQWLQSVPAKCGLLAAPFSTQSLNCARNKFEFRFSVLDSCEEGITECLRVADAETNSESSDPAPRASFDCQAPSSALEIVICADAELGQIDIKLAQAYRDASTFMVGEQRRHLIGSEHRWIHFVSKSCPLGAVGGIPSAIARACVREAFQVRIEQLQTCSQKEPRERTPCLNDFRLSEKK